jgi:hypothetical protein
LAIVQLIIGYTISFVLIRKNPMCHSYMNIFLPWGLILA